jgi:enoyl-CoA hydratase
MPAVIYERSEHLAHIRLNRPDNGNRFTTEMFRTLAQMFTALDADPEIRCTLLTASGEDFSLGVDVPDVLPAWAAGRSPFEDSQVNPFGTTGRHRRPRSVFQCRARTGVRFGYLYRCRQ